MEFPSTTHEDAIEIEVVKGVMIEYKLEITTVASEYQHFEYITSS